MGAEPQPLELASATAPELSFEVGDAAAERHGAGPAVNFTLAIERTAGAAVRSIVLDTQIQIAARRRPYSPGEQAALGELFGTSERWATTLRTLLWTRTTAIVPPFTQATEVQLQVPCSYDIEASAANYLAGLRAGDVPLEFLFSGSVFYAGPGGVLQAARISWDREAHYDMPVAVWREAMERHFPGCAWLRLERPAFDALRAYKAEHGLRTLGDAVARLLEQRP
jgi:hypothetical protein